MSTATSGISVCAKIAQRIEKSIGPRRFSMWFDRSTRFQYHDQQARLEVAVPNQFMAEWIGRHFQSELQRAAVDEVGSQVQLDLTVQPQKFQNSAATATGEPSHAAAAKPASPPRPTTRETLLRHRLEQFIVGPSNELAFAAAGRIVDDEQHSCNPLFIHGGCGLGKTHLLQGICRKMLDQRPDARVRYVTGEQFTNEYIAAVRSGRIEPFRKKIRRLDLLAIDDLHFIANKQGTQREFLHSFDAIELGGARVVMASDSHPKLIHSFCEALVSRCMRGMVVQVNQPDTATRVRIIRALAQRRGICLTEAVVNTICTRAPGSVREIEGALTKLHALAGLAESRNSHGNGTIGRALANQLFDSPPVHTGPRQAVRFDTILDVVANQLAVSRERIVGNSRQRHTVLARGLVAHLAYQMTSMSYPEVAAAMKRNSHSSVITADQRIKKQLAANHTCTMPDTLEQLALVDLIDRLRQAIRET